LIQDSLKRRLCRRVWQDTGEPLPEHISARWQDIESLINGLIATNNLLSQDDFDAVLAAAILAFGFVFIHPFEDGNGRIHRLIHHTLVKKHFSQQGIIFPFSASILNHIDNYRVVLQQNSHPLLDSIEWKETKNRNIEVKWYHWLLSLLWRYTSGRIPVRLCNRYNRKYHPCRSYIS
jgi:Fic family protein